MSWGCHPLSSLRRSQSPSSVTRRGNDFMVCKGPNTFTAFLLTRLNQNPCQAALGRHRGTGRDPCTPPLAAARPVGWCLWVRCPFSINLKTTVSSKWPCHGHLSGAEFSSELADNQLLWLSTLLECSEGHALDSTSAKTGPAAQRKRGVGSLLAH